VIADCVTGGHFVAVCRSVLQRVAACCSVLQRVAVSKRRRGFRRSHKWTVCCRVLQYDAACCSVLQCVAVCYVRELSTRCCDERLSHSMCPLTRQATHCNNTATCCKTLQHPTTHCNTLQHIATHCNTLQRHTATHCNTLQYYFTAYVLSRDT